MKEKIIQIARSIKQQNLVISMMLGAGEAVVKLVPAYAGGYEDPSRSSAHGGTGDKIIEGEGVEAKQTSNNGKQQINLLNEMQS